jgi:S-adenosylmethionine/arginine decarboxylase-like enzyme
MSNMTAKEMFAGWHFTMDAVVAAEKAFLLSDEKHIDRTFRDLVKVLDMQILVEPKLISVPTDLSKVDSDQDDGGVTGTCIITTSHLSFHSWPLRNRFSLDAFSCKEFDHRKAEAFLKDRFFVETASIHWLIRNWP